MGLTLLYDRASPKFVQRIYDEKGNATFAHCDQRMTASKA